MNVSGGVIAHSSGITFGQSISDTAALVEAKGVSGAKVLAYQVLEPILEAIQYPVILLHI
nr:fimbria/pilus outer membrane usher protein [Salmonella enterica]